MSISTCWPLILTLRMFILLFCGSHLDHFFELCFLWNDEMEDWYNVLITLANQLTADGFYCNFNGKRFKSSERRAMSWQKKPIHLFPDSLNCLLALFVLCVLLGAITFPADVERLKDLGVCGVITLTEPYETLFPTSLYQAYGINHLVLPTRDYLFAPSLSDIC
ncbi:uncharacterized protein LOC114291019 isoform X2 [Camellia sinensis]|uniref:uncharacterized protein LOC114291019 isoform X2 n=1 Tax=Camellia sinensis TaxID=4442 RepID=UPI001035CA82|nr:uncharacterized protein LOC114291019 isoform X2 [Camellia sinensis]XP_028090809.1 uncharacterized protein LOC114291019 isoform X2 [Camellia sinensis]